jgi:hypothetical protein
MLLKIQDQWINPQAIARVYQSCSDNINIEFVHGGRVQISYYTGDWEQDTVNCNADLQRILEAVNGVDKPKAGWIKPDAWDKASEADKAALALRGAPAVVGRSNQDEACLTCEGTGEVKVYADSGGYLGKLPCIACHGGGTIPLAVRECGEVRPSS